jgi:hypothetical protein
MFALTYISEAEQRFDEPALAELAAKAGEKNARLAITGYLNYVPERRTFFQFLEGQKPAVLGLMDEIARDGRHRVINLVELGATAERIFPSWNMRYLDAAFFQAVQLEDVLEGVLRTMQSRVFDHATIVATVYRLARQIAASRPA